MGTEPFTPHELLLALRVRELALQLQGLRQPDDPALQAQWLIEHPLSEFTERVMGGVEETAAALRRRAEKRANPTG